VLDSNVWVFYLRGHRDALELMSVLERISALIYVHAVIIEEVWRGVMEPRVRAYFTRALLAPNVRIRTEAVPANLVRKYEALGLHNGDPLIAAFTEFVNADFLITEDENFDVLKHAGGAPFRVMNIAEFLTEFEAFR